jgi:hypothetical protein
MMNKQNSKDQYGDKETKQRVQKALQGAFSAPPTPLKDIPTRYGESRKKRASGASYANAKTASPRKKNRA